MIAQNSTTSGNVNKILISNFSDNAAAARVDLILNDGTTDFYIIKNCLIPKGVTLVLEDNVSFNSEDYTLKMYSTGTAPALTVIIK